VLTVLHELDADVLALQELEWEAAVARDLLALFAGSLKCEGVAGPTLLAGSGHYGNALLSRLPVLSVRRIDLSVPGHERRGAIDVDLDAHGRQLRVMATHLGLAPVERRQQIRHLLQAMPNSRVEPLVLMGDLNEWFLWGRPLRLLRRHFGHPSAPATFPACVPLVALDHIWIQPITLRGRIRVHRSDAARHASDHLPVIMIVRLPGELA
jgi:endonuclease/exonuclease/phosphatase family metal-dependent hydrolase